MVAEFATIVGLLSAFSSGRTRGKQLELTEFLGWLVEHNHGDIKQSIEANQATCISIKAILNRGLADVHEKLEEISDRIAILLSRTSGVSELAAAYADASLSEQVLEILTLMEENESEYFLLSKELSSNEKRLILCPGPNYLCKEARFVEDDLQLMLGLGLLLRKSNSRGDPVYYYTRASSMLIRGMA